MDIFERDRAGLQIAMTDPEIEKMAACIHEAQRILAELNTGFHENREVQEIRHIRFSA